VEFNAEVRKHAIDFAILNHTILATLVSQAEKASGAAQHGAVRWYTKQNCHKHCFKTVTVDDNHEWI
jgi:hypothetical protein